MACRKQAKEQKLSGSERSAFLKDCIRKDGGAEAAERLHRRAAAGRGDLADQRDAEVFGDLVAGAIAVEEQVAEVDQVDASLDQVDEAVEAAKRHIFEMQHEDGHWVGELEADGMLEADYIFLHVLLETVDPKIRGRMQRALTEMLRYQNEDGSWSKSKELLITGCLSKQVFRERERPPRAVY